MSILYIELNLFGVILLAIVAFNLIRKGTRQVPYEQKVFMQLLIANIILFFLDAGMWGLDGKAFTGCHTLLSAVTALYYVFNTYICFLWLVYADFKLHGDKNRLKKRMPFYLISLSITVILVVVNLFTEILYEITAANVYVRGSMYYLLPVVSLIYIVFAEVLGIRALRRCVAADDRKMCLTMIIFPLPTVVATIVQSFIYGISIIWACTSLSLLIIYISIQNAQIFTDVLTGLFNRRQFERILDQRINTGRVFCVVMIDVDRFKSINDNYGHAVGDEVLVRIGGLLRQNCSGDDVAARYGGDEFVLVCDGKDTLSSEKIVRQIRESVDAFNRERIFKFDLSLSVGFAVFGEDDRDADALMRKADRRMYESKAERNGSLKNA